MDSVDKRMKAIREKYNITREELNDLGMDEFDYQNIKEQVKKDYIKGLLFEIVEKKTSIDQIADNIISMCKVGAVDQYQKIILGELSDCVKETTGQSQMIHVSCKIAEFLKAK